MLVNSSETLSEIVRGKGVSNFDRMLWGRLMSYIYEKPVETEVYLLARILSVCVNIKKYDICTRKQRTFCVTCRIAVTSQAASSTAIVNYS
jgi:hypothetical protein